jgi:hypothetical protein
LGARRHGRSRRARSKSERMRRIISRLIFIRQQTTVIKANQAVGTWV